MSEEKSLEEIGYEALAGDRGKHYWLVMSNAGKRQWRFATQAVAAEAIRRDGGNAYGYENGKFDAEQKAAEQIRSLLKVVEEMQDALSKNRTAL